MLTLAVMSNYTPAACFWQAMKNMVFDNISPVIVYNYR